MPKDMGGWMDRWVDVRHGCGDSHGRARKVLTDGQNNTQDMLIHKPRIDFKSLFSNAQSLGIISQARIFLTTVFLI